MTEHKHEWSWANDVHCTECGQDQDDYLAEVEARVERLRADIAALTTQMSRAGDAINGFRYERDMALGQRDVLRATMRDIVSAYDGAKVHASIDLDAAIDRARDALAGVPS